jgi:hypothetical protein
VAGTHEYRVDCVAIGACEVVAFKKAVAFRVTDDRFDGAATPQLPLDGRRSMAGALCDVDVGDGEPMSTPPDESFAPSRQEGVELVHDEIEVAVVFARRHEAEAVAGLEDDDADHQGGGEVL